MLVVVVILLSRRLKSSIPGQQEATYHNSDAAIRTNAGTEYDSGGESDKPYEMLGNKVSVSQIYSIVITSSMFSDQQLKFKCPFSCCLAALLLRCGLPPSSSICPSSVKLIFGGNLLAK